MSIAELEALHAEAQTALAAGNYDAAIAKAIAAKLRLATMPNLTRNLGGTQAIVWGGGPEITEFIKQCRMLKAESAAASSGPFQTIKVTYARPESSGDYS